MPHSLRGRVLDKTDAEKAVKSILEKEETPFHLVTFKDFKKSHQGSSLKSRQYERYNVLCHANTLFHAGWIVCPYVSTGFCGLAKGLFQINTRQGGTNRFGRHVNEHERGFANQNTMDQDLSHGCKKDIADAAALAVVLDLRPLSFAENREGMTSFARSVFLAGQSVPVGVSINPQSYLPSRTAVKSSLDRLEAHLKARFLKKLHVDLLKQGGAVSVDGVMLKLQGKHYYDFTIHHMEMKLSKNVVAFPKFSIKTSTILFMEGPSRSDALSIRNMIDENLTREYGIDLNAIQNSFTLVTDGAANMARMAGSSVSRRIAALDERWMRCLAHVLSISMKDAVKCCALDPLLVKISHDFKAMKAVVRDSKQGGWNHMLPIGFHLIQDTETRFGTHFLVARRFLKSADATRSLLISQNRIEAKNAFESIEKSTPPTTGYPTIEALVDAMKPVYEATVMFETAHEPTLHKVLPALQHCIAELSRIEVGGTVSRDNGQEARPSLYSMRMCGVMKTQLLKIEVHDLWLVACFLFPFLRDMEFWENPVERADFKVRAEALTRSLYQSEQSASNSTPLNNAEENLSEQLQGSQSNGIVLQQPAESPLRKRRKFSLQNHISRSNVSEEDQNEVNRYKDTSLRQMGIDHDAFLSNPFSVVHFWYGRKRAFPGLFKIAMRVFATPASSCASERVFSIVNKLVSPDRSALSTKHISQIIVARSLRPYET